MLIRDQLTALTQDGAMHHLGAATRRDGLRRNVFLTDDVYQRVRAAWSGDSATDFVLAGVIPLLQSFISGRVVTFGMDPHSKNQTCMMARTAPIEMNIVDFRSIDPRPGARLFGGFSECDVFVGLDLYLRDEMPERFSDAVIGARRHWNEIFSNSLPPINCDNIELVISENVLPV